MNPQGQPAEIFRFRRQAIGLRRPGTDRGRSFAHDSERG